MIGNEFSVIFCKSHGLGLGAWCCLHLYCAYPSPITQTKSQKTWSRWVRHMLNKIFPVVEDKCSSSRSVEQFRSIPGLSSHWGSAARCFSAESCWAGELGWWYLVVFMAYKRVLFKSPESFLQPLWPKHLGEETPCATKR